MNEENRFVKSAKSLWVIGLSVCLLGLTEILGVLSDLAQLESWITTGGPPVIRVVFFFIFIAAVGVLIVEKFQRNRRTAISAIVGVLCIIAVLMANSLWPTTEEVNANEQPTQTSTITTIPSSSAPVLAADPLVVATKTITHPCDSDWITPKTPEQLASSVKQLATVNDWADSELVADGAASGSGLVLMTAQGTGAASVVLTGLTIEVKDRKPPLVGTRLSRACGGVKPYRWVDVDLDRNPPPVVGRELDDDARQRAEEKGWNIEPVKFPYEVALQDSETFAVDSHTVTCDCTWVAHLSWSSAGKTGTLTIDNQGKPFRTSSDMNAVHCRILGESFICE